MQQFFPIEIVSFFRRKSFTLIVLPDVITIIGILAVLLLLVLSSAKESAKCTEFLNNLKQIGIGTAVYTGDKRDYGVVAKLNQPDNPDDGSFVQTFLKQPAATAAEGVGLGQGFFPHIPAT